MGDPTARDMVTWWDDEFIPIIFSKMVFRREDHQRLKAIRGMLIEREVDDESIDSKRARGTS